MRTRTMVIVGVVVAATAGSTYGLLEYDRTPETAAAKTEVASLSAQELLAAFVADEQAATAKYVGMQEQAILVSGVIRSVEPESAGVVTVILETGDIMAGILCEFPKADMPATWKAGDSVKLKGICTGYLSDVVLVRCVPVE